MLLCVKCRITLHESPTIFTLISSLLPNASAVNGKCFAQVCHRLSHSPYFVEFTCDSSKIPIVAHATHNASASIQQPSGTIVRYTCSDGYSKVVAGDIKCVGTSWTGSLPSCQASSTSALPPAGEPPTDQGARNSSTKIGKTAKSFFFIQISLVGRRLYVRSVKSYYRS